MKRVPSFSSRPGFPSGLQVLLVEADEQSRHTVSQQLKELSYIGTWCCNIAEAVKVLASTSGRFDIILAEANTVAGESPAFVNALNGMPLVLMSEGGSATKVWKSIELGAVEYLEKPLSTLKLRNIWQHVVRKMVQGCEQEDSSCKTSCRESDQTQTSLHQQKSFSQPDSPSTPSALSSGIDQDFTLVDDSLKSFKLCEGVSSSSQSDPSDLFLPDITTSDTLDSKPVVATASTAHSNSDVMLMPAAKKMRRSKDSSTATATTAFMTHRPPLAIRPAPSGFSMMQQPMSGGHWGGHQNMPGYLWGTPMPGSHMGLDRSASFQMSSNQSCGFPVYRSELQRHHSMPNECYPLASAYSQASCDAGITKHDPSLNLDMTSSDTVLDGLPSFGNVFFEDTDSQVPNSPPIGLQLRKSESFLDLINEHLKHAT